jgi:hypothetical protein
MINAEFLASCTDEQINRGVAWLVVKEWGLGNKHKRKSIDYYCSQGLFNSVAVGNVNYCTNPSDIMPIAFANNFLIEPPNFFTSKWTIKKYYIVDNIGERNISATNTNPLRAICEAYILMSVNK